MRVVRIGGRLAIIETKAAPQRWKQWLRAQRLAALYAQLGRKTTAEEIFEGSLALDWANSDHEVGRG